MKKFNLLLIVFTLSILMSIFVSGSSFERYGLNYYTGHSDSYALRSSPLNGIDYNNLQSCNVGYGTELGVYPVTLNDNNILYEFLVVPTHSAIRIINSACGEINVIAPSSVTFYGTMSTVDSNGISPEMYVILGYNSSNNKYGFYGFGFDTATETIQLKEYKQIGSDIDTDKFNGVACGWEEKTSSDAGCSITNSNNLIYWDLSTNSITNYTMSGSLDRVSGSSTPFGAVVDFDNDGHNEVFYGKIAQGYYKTDAYYSVFDLVTKTFDFNYEHLEGVAPSYSADGILQINGQNLQITPCQIGGLNSEFEICINVAGKSSSSNERTSHVVVEYDKTIHTYNGASLGDFSSQNMIPMMTYDYTGDGNNEFIFLSLNNYGEAKVNIYDSSYTLLNSWILPIEKDGSTTINTFLMDVDNDGVSDLILNNGEMYDLLNLKYPYELPYLNNNSDGYLVAGDLNQDYENEIIYSDASNIYIYSTNPSNDYILNLSEPIPYAIDEDGLNYTLKSVTYNGTTTNGISVNDTVLWDVCFDSRILNEAFLYDKEVSAGSYDCVYHGYDLCQDGACIYNNTPSDENTTYRYGFDTDNGYNLYVRGVAYNGTTLNGTNTNQTISTDTCSGNTLIEYHIVSYNVVSSIYDCSSEGDLCEDGACVDSISTTSTTLVTTQNCRDSDGDNPSSIGNINTDVGIYNDKCLDNNHVREYLCKGNIGAYNDYDCDSLGYDYCEGGRCRDNIALKTSPYIVDTSNPDNVLSIDNSTGLLPDLYHGILEFFRQSFKPLMFIFVIIMILLLTWGLRKKIEDLK